MHAPSYRGELELLIQDLRHGRHASSSAQGMLSMGGTFVSMMLSRSVQATSMKKHCNERTQRMSTWRSSSVITYTSTTPIPLLPRRRR